MSAEPPQSSLPRRGARRLGAAAMATTLLALVACDLEVAGFRRWWEQHSLTGSIVGSLLVVGVTALIFDEVIARQQRRERATSVAVQGLILYAQARRAFAGMVATGQDSASQTDVGEELRSLASMLLSASPSLFDDPISRVLLVSVQRLMGTMLQATRRGPDTVDRNELLAAQMSDLQAAMAPLSARLPAEYQSMLADTATTT